MTGLTFPTPIHQAIFVMVIATLIYLAIGLVLTVTSTLRILAIPEVRARLARESRGTLAFLLLGALKANLFHWPLIYLHRSHREPDPPQN